jgi:radical SAM protein (TIGR01212 family)
MPAGPFPYRRFSDYLKETFGEKVYRVPVHGGFTCPNRDGVKGRGGCVYCDTYGSAAPFIRKALPIKKQIAEGRKRILKRYKAKKFIVYFQAFTNTYAAPHILREVYKQAVGEPGMVGVAIATRPDCIDPAKLDVIQDVFGDYAVWMEYGLQSAHEASLAWMRRGHGVDAFSRAVAVTRAYPFRICAHIIFGLPVETKEMMLKTVDFLSDTGVDDIKIHMLHILKGSSLEEVYRITPFPLLDRKTYISIVCDAIERLPESVVVQRLTGDAPTGRLVAPDWVRNKQVTLQKIQEELKRRATKQGAKSGQHCFV